LPACARRKPRNRWSRESKVGGLVSVSVPVFNRKDLVVDALHASTGSAQSNKERLTGEFVSKLKAMAAELSTMLP
jgi:DNA-binding IclR family transcriptional regulator